MHTPATHNPATQNQAFFHPHSRALQDAADSRRIADRIAELRRHDVFSEDDIDQIEAASMFFLATADGQGRPDCSVKGGAPGFVQVVGPDRLRFADYDGNGMFRSLGNIAANAAVGLLFVDFATGRKMRINGTARLERAGATLQVEVTAGDIFPNCPRYLPRLILAEASPYNPRPGHQPPPPPWKGKPELRDYLPRQEAGVAPPGRTAADLAPI